MVMEFASLLHVMVYGIYFRNKFIKQRKNLSCSMLIHVKLKPYFVISAITTGIWEDLVCIYCSVFTLGKVNTYIAQHSTDITIKLYWAIEPLFLFALYAKNH